MSNFISRLNSAERRFMVGVGLLFFFVINIFWVWPRFSEWGQLKLKLANSRRDVGRREVIIQEANRLKPKMDDLTREGGVPPYDQSMQFLRAIQTQAGASGVNFNSNSRQITSTNDPFFIEQLQTISVVSGEKQMVDFLYNLGLGNTQIRVRALSVRPDTARQQLNANITLVASYQKDRPVARTAARPTTTTTTAKPATPPPATKPTVAPATKPTTAPATKPVVPPATKPGASPTNRPAAPKPTTPNK